MATCEIEEFPQKVLKKNFPEAYHHGDIHSLTGKRLFDEIEKRFKNWQGEKIILTGGFPCQPFSTAGNRNGSNDDRFLWPEYLRIIREVKPNWIVGENVAGIRSMVHSRKPWKQLFAKMAGGKHIAGPYFRFFGRKREFGILYEIIKDLEKEGYSVQIFSIPAAGIGAIHRRDRIWIVANNENQPNRKHNYGKGEGQKQQSGKSFVGSTPSNALCNNGRKVFLPERAPILRPEFEQFVAARANTNPEKEFRKRRRSSRERRAGFTNVREINATNAKKERLQKRRDLSMPRKPQHGEFGSGVDAKELLRTTVSPVCRADDGLSFGLEPNRRKRLAALGNAIVPQVALQIFKAINEFEKQSTL